jgi:hypothetical protein
MFHAAALGREGQRVAAHFPALPPRALLEGPDDRRQLGGARQQRLQAAPPAPAGAGPARAVLAGGPRQRQAAADGPQGGGVGDAERPAQALLRRVVPQPHRRQQELVGRRQVEAAADGPAAAAPSAAAPPLGLTRGRRWLCAFV